MREGSRTLRAIAWALVAAFAIELLLRLTFVVRTRPTNTEAFLYILVAAILMALPVAVFYQRFRWRDRILFCVLEPGATVGFEYVSDTLARPYWEATGHAMVFVPIDGLMPLFLDEATLAVFGLLACFAMLALCEVAFGADVVDTSPRCRGCGYNLTGCESLVCPECGRPTK